MCQVPRSTLAAWIRTRTWSAATAGPFTSLKPEDVLGGSAVIGVNDRHHRPATRWLDFG